MDTTRTPRLARPCRVCGARFQEDSRCGHYHVRCARCAGPCPNCRLAGACRYCAGAKEITQ